MPELERTGQGNPAKDRRREHKRQHHLRGAPLDSQKQAHPGQDKCRQRGLEKQRQGVIEPHSIGPHSSQCIHRLTGDDTAALKVQAPPKGRGRQAPGHRKSISGPYDQQAYCRQAHQPFCPLQPRHRWPVTGGAIGQGEEQGDGANG